VASLTGLTASGLTASVHAVQVHAVQVRGLSVGASASRGTSVALDQVTVG
jgi:hypothetical protein